MPLILPTLLPLIIGIILLCLSMYLLFRAHILAVLLKVIPGLLLLFCAVILIFSSMDMMSYRQLLKEESVATLHFEQLAPQSYEVMVIDKGNQQHYFHLKGDQWQLDARMIRWHPSLIRIGFQPLYRLDRIGGRYTDIQQELHSDRTVYQIASSELALESGEIGRGVFTGWGIDTWRWFHQWEWLHSWVDADYGTATFVPMAHGAVYEVTVGYSGLVARPVNEKSRRAVAAWQ